MVHFYSEKIEVLRSKTTPTGGRSSGAADSDACKAPSNRGFPGTHILTLLFIAAFFWGMADSTAVLGAIETTGSVKTAGSDGPVENTSGTVQKGEIEAETNLKGKGKNPNIRRFSILVGANNGGPNRETLRYAVSDALALRDIFTSMGGIEGEDCIVQIDPDRNELLDALGRVETMASEAHSTARRVEVIFYYSGHSDVEGLLLGGEHLQYKTLRGRFDRIPADVRIAILDSCFSGAFTRLKGGSTQAPFLTDPGYDMKGYAFLSSSSSNEASQESDRLKSSFFTHYLAAGLRGAADHNNDDNVTLNELYQFAYNETLSRTEKTFAGPQHPNYSIQMSGTGDVVITRVRSGGSVLVLPEYIGGRVSIHNSRAKLIAEIRKEPGRNTSFALKPDRYTVLYEADGALHEAKINLTYGSEIHLARDDFSVAAYEYTRLRGGPRPPGSVADGSASGGASAEYRSVPFSFSPAPIKNYSDKTVHSAALGLMGTYSTVLDGISVSAGVGVVEEDARWLMAHALGNYVRGDVSGIQAAGLGNIVEGKFDGIQNSGGLNYTAGDFKGIQSAVINGAGRIDGIQVGVINWAGQVDGMQVGVVNLTGEMNGVPVGLINISKNGGIELQGYTGGQTDFNTALLFRSGNIYTRFTSGISAGKDSRIHTGSTSAEASFGLHFGARIPLRRFYIDIDFGASTLDFGKSGIFMDPYDESSEDLLAPQARGVLGFALTTRISLFAGAGIYYPIDISIPEEAGPVESLFVAGTSFRVF